MPAPIPLPSQDYSYLKKKLFEEAKKINDEILERALEPEDTPEKKRLAEKIKKISAEILSNFDPVKFGIMIPELWDGYVKNAIDCFEGRPYLHFCMFDVLRDLEGRISYA